MSAVRIAVEPQGIRPWLAEAVVEGGGDIAPPSESEGLVWAASDDPVGLRKLLDANPNIRWVQLPWAGIESYLDVIDDERVWTAGQGVYAEPVAEHILALTLAGMRNLHEYSRATEWTQPAGRNLLGAKVLVVGGGGITHSLMRLLWPFGVDVTVLRRTPSQVEWATHVGTLHDLLKHLPEADVVILALPLTPETEGIMGPIELASMKRTAWLINVARGKHVDTDALVEALEAGDIAGAAIDVTDPEPLPPDHPLWTEPRCLITPHVGNTPEMAVPLLRERVAENVKRYMAGEALLGVVDLEAGY